MGHFDDAAFREGMRIRLEFSNMMAERAGAEHGLTDDDLDGMRGRIETAVDTIAAKRLAGQLEWMDLPYQDAVASKVVQFADKHRGQFENFVVLGIGGSALGNVAVQSALCHPYHNLLSSTQRAGRPRIFVLDNIDPDLMAATLDVIDVKKTLFNVITKSGSTAETMAQMLFIRGLLRDRLGDDYYRHIVVTTDPVKGDARVMVSAERYASFPISPGVGGRSSVLSAVGLLPSAFVGIDVGELLAGAAYADEMCQKPDVWSNPAAMGAALQWLSYERGRHISVLMPYIHSLRYVGDWYRQLWAESLGKKVSTKGEVVNIGPTPLNALGVADQHSMLQLFMEGPFDKIVGFVVVERFANTPTVPGDVGPYESTKYLVKRTFNELMTAEQLGVEVGLAAAGRPNYRIAIPEVNAFTVGQLLYILEVQTAIAGELFGINAFDQPGVEAGKSAAYAVPGRDGYEVERARMQAWLTADPRHII